MIHGRPKGNIRHACRKRDLEIVKADERASAIEQRIPEVNDAMQQLKAPFHTFPQVTAWEDSYLYLDHRWKMLVLCADSASGKSSFAESLFDNPCVLTVEGAETLDLKDLEYEAHDGLILDNARG